MHQRYTFYLYTSPINVYVNRVYNEKDIERSRKARRIQQQQQQWAKNKNEENEENEENEINSTHRETDRHTQLPL